MELALVLLYILDGFTCSKTMQVHHTPLCRCILQMTNPCIIHLKPHFLEVQRFIVCRYVYLLDQHGKIRWRASGRAEPDELKSLISAAENLVNGDVDPRTG